MYASVILPLALPQVYTWQVPAHMQQHIAVGMRVEVVLKKQTHYIGIVYKLQTEAPKDAKQIQPILALIDEVPLVSEHALALWQFVSEYYMCSIGEVMKAALPAPLRLSSDLYIIYNENIHPDFSDLKKQEYLLAQELLMKKKIKWHSAIALLKEKNIYPYIQTLFFKNFCYIEEDFAQYRQDKIQQHITLSNHIPKHLTPKQLHIIDTLKTLIPHHQIITRTLLKEHAKTSFITIQRLIDLDILHIEKIKIDRIKTTEKKINIDFTLTASQQIIYDQLIQHWHEKTVTLLHGVSSAGKTHIYIKSIETIIKQNQQVLYLLPEILVTTQLIQKIQKYFGGYVGFFHSKMHLQERIEIWEKVQRKEILIIVGVRSALFLPFQNLRLIICDEEHDMSYKQVEPAPRYHARDVAIWLAKQTHAKIILGSATPSLESYYHALQNKYHYLYLENRYTDIPLPEIEIFDLKKYIGGVRKEPWISPPLIAQINECLANKEQILFFQNRRGYTPYILCEHCGYIPYCEHCNIPLSYHKQAQQFKCHACNYVRPVMLSCPICKQNSLVYKQFGTEKLEENIIDYFPDIRIARVDWDTTKTKYAFEKILQKFSQQQLDAIVGTQMITKGLDFPNLSLVVIPNADRLLFYQNFRNNERLFQIIEQVGGRAGRSKPGKVFIQTSQPQHPIFEYIQKHDYRRFADNELQIRKQFFYPPYSRVIKITLKHKKESTLNQAAFFLYEWLQQAKINHLYPPVTPFINKLKNLYIQEIHLRLPNQTQYLFAFKKYLLTCIYDIKSNKTFHTLYVVADIDNID